MGLRCLDKMTGGMQEFRIVIRDQLSWLNYCHQIQPPTSQGSASFSPNLRVQWSIHRALNVISTQFQGHKCFQIRTVTSSVCHRFANPEKELSRPSIRKLCTFRLPVQFMPVNSFFHLLNWIFCCCREKRKLSVYRELLVNFNLF
jgi:hypothetical protein